MIAAVLVLFAVAIAVEAHVRGRHPDAHSVRRSLVLFVAGFVVQRLAWLGMRPDAPMGAFPTLALLQELAGLAAWTGLVRLVACGARRRDVVVRVLFALVVLLFATVADSVQAAIVFTVLGAISFRWTRLFTTGQRFVLALVALGLFVLGTRSPAPEPYGVAGATRAAVEFGRWIGGAAIAYAALGALALFRAFTSDPSLGIRTVGRRLALSHVLVVVVPLVLLGLLWAFTTVLGVNSDRAMVAARALEGEGERLREVLVEASAAGDRAGDVARGRFASRARAWQGARLWTRAGGAWTRVAGDSLPGEERLEIWPDSLARLPRAAVIDLQGRLLFGVAWRDSADSSRAAIAVVDADSLLATEPARIADSKLRAVSRVALGTAAGDRGVDAIRGVADEARERPRGAVETEPLTRQDSIEVARVRRTLRRFGVADTFVRAERRGGRLNIRTGDDTLQFRNVGAGGGNPLLEGHALVPGIVVDSTRLRGTRAMLTSAVDPSAALAGLFRNLSENPLGVLPLILIGLLTVLVLVVAVFDFTMVAGMGRSITAAIGALKGGAERLEAGDLAHRVEVKGDDDLWEVAGAFNQAMAGFERSRELEKERTRLENELALAQQIQARLLPPGPPAIPGFEIAGHYDPARQVGGDYYDHLDLGGGRVLLVIADVSGKGVPAALLMSGFRASLMSHDLTKPDPVALAGHLNDFLVRSVETGKFVTAFLAIADSREGALRYVNAGHNPPLLLRADGSHASLEEGGLMFGVFPGAPYESGRTSFGPGDLLVLYTDGVVEGASASQELWGDERLLHTARGLAARPCTELVDSIAREVRTFEGDAGPADDVTLLVARRV